MADTKDLLKLAEEIIDTNANLTENAKLPFTELAESLSAIQLGDDITKPLLALLSLPDEQFKIISPILLVEFAKDFHDSNNQLIMLQTFNAQGITLENFADDINTLIDEIDNINDELSQTKKDFLKQIFMDLYNSISEIRGIPKHIIEIPLELCNENAKIPCYANPTDSGMDIYALEDITIHPGETIVVPTGLKVAIPVGYELQVRPKSGRALKTKLRIANTPGTIDAGYRDEIGVIIDNIDAPIKKLYMNDNGSIAGIDHGSSYTIGKGEKFAQLVLCQVAHCSFQEIDSVSEINNDGRHGGFGSTGLK